MEPAEQGTAVPGGVAALSLPSRIVIAVAVAVGAVAAALHLAMVFLHVAPENTITKQHGDAIDGYVYPEFEQNWKLFAPNPLQQNIAVQVRAQTRTPAGGTATTRWIDLSAQDGKAILHNPLPSHTEQNELRRAWDFYTGSHDGKNRPDGLRGRLAEKYVLRLVMSRLGAEEDGGRVERIQVRSSTTPVTPPPWSGEKADGRAVDRVLPWWTVTAADLPEGAGSR